MAAAERLGRCALPIAGLGEWAVHFLGRTGEEVRAFLLRPRAANADIRSLEFSSFQ